MAERLSRQVMVRLSDADMEWLALRAKTEERPVAQVIRRLIRRERDRRASRG